MVDPLRVFRLRRECNMVESHLGGTKVRPALAQGFDARGRDSPAGRRVDPLRVFRLRRECNMMESHLGGTKVRPALNEGFDASCAHRQRSARRWAERGFVAVAMSQLASSLSLLSGTQHDRIALGRGESSTRSGARLRCAGRRFVGGAYGRSPSSLSPSSGMQHGRIALGRDESSTRSGGEPKCESP